MNSTSCESLLGAWLEQQNRSLWTTSTTNSRATTSLPFNITNFTNYTILEINNNESFDVYDPTCRLKQFQDFYHPIHGWLAMVVCVLGTLFNLANILVLTHRDMRNPVNMILTGIAVADFLNTLEYIPFTVYMNLLDTEARSPEEEYSLAWGIFMLFHTNFTLMIHTVAIWLTLSLAIWRFIMIKFPSKAVKLCTDSRSKLVLVLGFAGPFLLTIPNMFLTTLHASELKVAPGGQSCYTEYRTGLNTGTGIKGELLFSLIMWLYSILLKLVPCLVLTIFTASLIRAMYQAAANTAKLKGRQVKQVKDSRSKNTDKTTKLLIVIVALFLAAEFPQGILGMLSAILGTEFFMSCYHPLGELMDLLALVNSAANFLLYCIMSSQFRATIRKILGIKKAPSTTSVTVTTKLEKTDKKEVVVELVEHQNQDEI